MTGQIDQQFPEKKLFEIIAPKTKKGEKISKNCVLVFGKVKQNSDGEVRILLGK